MRQLFRLAVVTCILLLVLATSSNAGVVTFDFEADTGFNTTPSTPFNYTIGSLTASFSGSTDPGAFVVLPSGGLFSTLSGNILSNSTTPVASLTIGFNAPQVSISMNFADALTTDLVDLSAYLGGAGGTLVGTSIQSAGAGPFLPEGILGFSGGTFDTVVLTTESGNLAIDNITVNSGLSSAPEPGSLLLCAIALAVLSFVQLRRRIS